MIGLDCGDLIQPQGTPGGVPGGVSESLACWVLVAVFMDEAIGLDIGANSPQGLIARPRRRTNIGAKMALNMPAT